MRTNGHGTDDGALGETLELVAGTLDLEDALDELAEFLVERWLERHGREGALLPSEKQR